MDRRSVPVILGGGGGTRLWPVSRDSFPKQFLKILAPTSSLQQAVLRTSAKEVFARPIVMTIDPYRFLVRQQLEEIGCDAEIVIEPVRAVVPVSPPSSSPQAAATSASAETAASINSQFLRFRMYLLLLRPNGGLSQARYRPSVNGPRRRCERPVNGPRRVNAA